MTEKVLIVGDIHGDWGKLNQLLSKKQPDIVMQCGDFGWWPKMEVNRPVLYGQQKGWKLHGVKPQSSQVYFCDGNHEEHPELIQDGFIHEMYDGVRHASRGSTLTLPDGRVALFMGGADSVDKNLRTPGHDWFYEENITQGQLLRAVGKPKVDIVISHTCPDEFEVVGSEGKYKDSNRLALSNLLYNYNPDQWFFGHWHKSQHGIYNETNWECLDYPGHGGKWWRWL